MVAVRVADADGHGVADLTAEDRLADGRLLAHEALEGVAAHGGHDLKDLFLPQLDHTDRHPVVQPDLVGGGMILDHAGRGDHALEVADAAFVAVLLLLGRLVLVVFAQVAEGAGALDLLNQLRHQTETAVVQLRLHFLNILCGQLVVHG